MRHGRVLLGPDQSARGLAQSKTLARRTMAHVNAKRLGLRWPSTAFPQAVSPKHFSENKIALMNFLQQILEAQQTTINIQSKILQMLESGSFPIQSGLPVQSGPDVFLPPPPPPPIPDVITFADFAHMVTPDITSLADIAKQRADDRLKKHNFNLDINTPTSEDLLLIKDREQAKIKAIERDINSVKQKISRFYKNIENTKNLMSKTTDQNKLDKYEKIILSNQKKINEAKIIELLELERKLATELESINISANLISLEPMIINLEPKGSGLYTSHRPLIDQLIKGGCSFCCKSCKNKFYRR